MEIDFDVGFLPSKEDRERYEDARNPEKWKEIKNYPGYQISTWGRVRRRDERGFWFMPKIFDRGGYLRVVLRKKGKQRWKFVHRLQAFVFLGDPPHESMIVMHKDDNRKGAFPCNLRWGTKAENNQQHASRNQENLCKPQYKMGSLNIEKKPIPGFIGYEATAEGEIISHKRGGAGRIMRGTIGDGGYRKVEVSGCGKREVQMVHKLVALAFHGLPLSPNLFVRHLDDNPLNNRKDNLCWGTHSENMQDRTRNGNAGNPGERNGNARLSESQVITIREELEDGRTATDLAYEYQVHISTISKISCGKTWKHLL